jgi:hypothetical protein
MGLGACPPAEPLWHRYGLPDFYELHVWHEKANRNGTFNDWNPDVRCN